ncbi:MAG: hypothetical protein M4579_001259 [Chaenotheca gracillima]|nr:MAG: hypothetical protein M4579_001259 [Chaenotheca gracillima]
MASGSAPFFALPIQPGRVPVSQRAAAYGPQSKKRKRGRDDDESSASSAESDGEPRLPSRAGSPATTPTTNFTPINPSQARSQSLGRSQRNRTRSDHDVEQDRVAGQPIDQPLPGNNFPHRGRVAPSREELQRSLVTELSHVKSTQYASAVANPRTGRDLRRTHLSVITTILHRCLLEGDYIRASRAWGLILRSDIGGRAPDVRGHGRWGIGAELLLRRDGQQRSQDQMQNVEPEQSDSGSEGPSNGTPRAKAAERHPRSAPWTEEGIARAKDYYERLILQYPFHRRQPQATNPFNFYPAMFALWIYSVQEKGRRGEGRRRRKRASSVSSSTRKSRSRSRSRSRSSSPPPSTSEAEEEESQSALHSAILDEAVLISARMDDVLSSPPYSDSVPLWHLRGMVALWIYSLCSPSRYKALSGDEVDELVQQDRDWRRGNENEKAKEAFARVRKGGNDIWEGIPEDFLEDDGEWRARQNEESLV